jgi:type IV pili sensor histidine kinase/response regulator
VNKEHKLLALGLLLSQALLNAGVATNVTQINRYATIENKPLASQVNPLLAVQQVHFPEGVRTVGDAVQHWLRYSGFALVDAAILPMVLKEVLEQPLPQVQRNLGPLTVQDGLQVLVGQSVFTLVQDPLHRRVSFKLKPQFAHLASHTKRGQA